MPAEPPGNRLRVLGAAGLVALLAFIQRRAGLSSWSYWLDEAMQVSMVGGSLRDAWHAVASDGVHPPLDYLLTFLSVHLGGGAERTVRLLPALWSALTVPALFSAAGGARRPARAFGAALFYAATPLAVHLGQEVRPYALAILLVSLAAALVDGEPTPRRLALLSSVSLLACLTLYLAALPIAALWIALLWRARREGIEGAVRRTLLFAAPPFACLLGWLFLVRASLVHPGERIGADFSARAILRLLAGLLSWREESVAFVTGAALPAILVAAGLALAWKRAPRDAALLAATTLAPAALLAAAGHWLSLRYFALALVPCALLAGAAVEAIASRSRTTALAVLAAAVALHVPAYAEIRRSARPDFVQPAAYLGFVRGSCPVVAAGEWTYLTLRVQPALGGPLLLARTADEARAAMDGNGWLVSSGSHAPEWLSSFVGGTRPWATFPDAEGARVFRVSRGNAVAP